MATTTTYIDADSPTRKRSISDNDSPTFASCPSPKKVEYTVSSSPLYSSSSHSTPRRTPQHYRKGSWDKGRRASSRIANMQASSSSQFAISLPSFMSVIDQSSQTSDSPQPSHSLFTKEAHSHDQIFSPIEAPSFNPFHQPRHSTSTSASESADSSPTTTVSLDSTSMTDPSPGPSPQSPTSMSFPMSESRFTPIESPIKSALSEPTLPVFEVQQRPTLASKRPRNLKNLAVNTSASYGLGRALATAPLQPQEPLKLSAPASPAFVKPPTPPKRKLGKLSLTIVTPANPNGVPSTPALSRPATLRHFQSSPSLPLHTAGAGPAGGMTLPRPRITPALRGFAEVTLEEDEEEEEQNFDVPQSREDKPESYPNGPIRIYESGVDLFYEPNVEIASRYDVILNVASEVKNPFDVAEEAARLGASAPQTTQSVGLLSSTPSGATSPTTPRATPITADVPISSFPIIPSKRPEYIHIPWEHNTDLVPELHQLVKVIDDRVKQGKKVLVHCQCGVSRSATLIVAYGLYINPELSVPEAYDAVKKRSKWIAPNMGLIMQLTQFKNELTPNARRDHGYQSQVFKLPRNTPTAASSNSEFFDVKVPSEPATPRIIPFNAGNQTSPQRLDPSAVGPFSAQPVESTSGFWDNAFKRRSWGSGPGSSEMALEPTTVTDSNYVDTSGHVVPVTVMQTNSSSTTDSAPLLAPPPKRASKRSSGSINRLLPFRRDYSQEDTKMTDAPSLEPLMSPRASEFHMAPLVPSSQFESADMFGIMSPTTNNFPTQLIDAPSPSMQMADAPPSEPLFSPRAAEFHMAPLLPSSKYQSADTFGIMSPTSTEFPNPMALPLAPALAPTVSCPPPEPARAAPPPPQQRREIPMESLNSIFSPTVDTFPSLLPLAPLDASQTEQNNSAKNSERTDSMTPLISSIQLNSPPTSNRRLRKKFSAPNLSECVKLQKIQSDIASQLPRRPAEAEEALMSPRVGEFMANPFHSMPIKEESTILEETRENTLFGNDLSHPTIEIPATPTKNDVDPRSPAQFGISPITRSIWDVI